SHLNLYAHESLIPYGISFRMKVYLSRLVGHALRCAPPFSCLYFRGNKTLFRGFEIRSASPEWRPARKGKTFGAVCLAILGLSGSGVRSGTTMTPIAVTGLNRDVVIE